MQTLKEKLFAHVNEVLEGVEDPTLPAVRSGPWRKAWEKAFHFLRRSQRETQNDSELREKLQELHQDIQNQVSSEVRRKSHKPTLKCTFFPLLVYFADFNSLASTHCMKLLQGGHLGPSTFKRKH